MGLPRRQFTTERNWSSVQINLPPECATYQRLKLCTGGKPWVTLDVKGSGRQEQSPGRIPDLQFLCSFSSALVGW